MRSFATATAAGLFLALGFTTAAHAANFVVNENSFQADNNIGNGVCDAAGAVNCTLRAAIQEANFTPAADTITRFEDGHLVSCGLESAARGKSREAGAHHTDLNGSLVHAAPMPAARNERSEAPV